MTFWLDAHLDPDLAAWLGATFKVVAKMTREVGLHEATDEVLFDAARRVGRIVIITKDRDLAERVQKSGAPPQILWLRLRNMRTPKIRSLLPMTFAEALRLLEGGSPLVEIDHSGRCTAII